MATVRVSRINVTPVKSLALHHPEEIALTRSGALDDRRFVLVDGAGRLYNGKRDGQLVRSRADWDAAAGTLAITLPGGDVVAGDVERGRAAPLEVYGRRMTAREVLGPWADALSDAVGRSLRLLERPEGGIATDTGPATLISRSSLDAIDGDGRRFRMLLELEGLDAFAEDAWEGCRLRVGGIGLLVGAPTPRCAVPTHSPDTGVRDRDTLRELTMLRGRIGGEICLGIYAEVLEPGTVRVGDPVERM